MIQKGIKQGSVFVLAAVLVFSALILPKVYAAVGVETDKVCSVEINALGCDFKELNGKDPLTEVLAVTVNLYKVADVNTRGDYLAVDAFKTLDFSSADADTSAQQWSEWAEAAKAEVNENTIRATASGTTENGVVTMTGLATGLYLVDAQQVLSDNYQYDFIPYLIALPNNYYKETDPSDDTWVYDLTGEKAIGLKPSKSDRYGELIIQKSLDVYNETIGGATFVFQVEGFKTDIDTGMEKMVYSNVVSMTFKDPGTDRIIISDLPAGSVVTVTEIYTGASYRVTSAGVQTAVILADPEQVKVEFANTYDQRLNGGNGVVNTFSYHSDTKEWTHSATEDSTP